MLFLEDNFHGQMEPVQTWQSYILVKNCDFFQSGCTGRCWAGPGSGGRGTCRGDFYQLMRRRGVISMMMIIVDDSGHSNEESWFT